MNTEKSAAPEKIKDNSRAQRNDWLSESAANGSHPKQTGRKPASKEKRQHTGAVQKKAEQATVQTRKRSTRQPSETVRGGQKEQKTARNVPNTRPEDTRAVRTRQRGAGTDAVRSERAPRPPVQATTKMDKPAKKHRQYSKKAVALTCLIVLLIGALGFAGYQFLRVNTLEVRGNLDRSAEYIAQLSGIELGSHVFLVDKAQAEQSIATDPFLSLKDIEYSFPDKLTLVVEERRASACFEHNGRYIVTDASGYVLQVLAEGEEPSVPLVDGLHITQYTVCYKTRMDDTFKQSVLEELLVCLREKGLNNLVASIDIETVSEIWMTTVQNLHICLGDSENFEQKLNWVVSVVPALAEEGHFSGTLDVSSASEAVYSQKGTDAQPTDPSTPSNDLIYY